MGIFALRTARPNREKPAASSKPLRHQPHFALNTRVFGFKAGMMATTDGRAAVEQARQRVRLSWETAKGRTPTTKRRRGVGISGKSCFGIVTGCDDAAQGDALLNSALIRNRANPRRVVVWRLARHRPVAFASDPLPHRHLSRYYHAPGWRRISGHHRIRSLRGRAGSRPDPHPNRAYVGICKIPR